MRLVLDTVVLVRGLMGPQGAQGRLIFDRADEYVWITSPEIVAEYLDVLYRPELQRRFRRVGMHHRDVLLRQIADSTSVRSTLLPGICRDPHDDMFLAAAVAGGADYIVSEDLDLLSLGEYAGVGVCTTSAMLALLAQDGAEDADEQ